MTITFNFTSFLAIVSLLLASFISEPAGLAGSPPSSGETVVMGRLAPNDWSVYSDALASGWDDWSWNVAVNLNNSNPVHSGTRCDCGDVQSGLGRFPARA